MHPLTNATLLLLYTQLLDIRGSPTDPHNKGLKRTAAIRPRELAGDRDPKPSSFRAKFPMGIITTPMKTRAEITTAAMLPGRGA